MLVIYYWQSLMKRTFAYLTMLMISRWWWASYLSESQPMQNGDSVKKCPSQLTQHKIEKQPAVQVARIKLNSLF